MSELGQGRGTGALAMTVPRRKRKLTRSDRDEVLEKATSEPKSTVNREVRGAEPSCGGHLGNVLRLRPSARGGSVPSHRDVG